MAVAQLEQKLCGTENGVGGQVIIRSIEVKSKAKTNIDVKFEV